MEKKDLLIAKVGEEFKIGAYNNSYTRIKTFSDNQVYDINSGYYIAYGDSGNTIAIDATNGYETIQFLPLAVSKNNVSRSNLAGVRWENVEEIKYSNNWEQNTIDDSYYVLTRALNDYFSNSPNNVLAEIGNIIPFTWETEEIEGGWDRVYTTDIKRYDVHDSISKDAVIDIENDINVCVHSRRIERYIDQDREF